MDTQGPAPTQPPRYAPPPPPPRKSCRGRTVAIVVLAVLLVFSVLLNLLLLGLVAGGLEADHRIKQRVISEGAAEQVVAVYELSGIIDDDAADHFDRFARAILPDQNVRAVVLRINSPGGGVAASDRIHHAIVRLRETNRKVVVSMGGLAASGGYYVSASADRIVAEPTTITGSIGVIMAWPVISGTLDKLGIDAVVLKSDDAEFWKDEISSFHPPNDRQREHLKSMLNRMQDRFEQVVREGRGQRLVTRRVLHTLPAGPDEQAKAVEEIAPLNGKVYLAGEALELGLVDAIGYLNNAIDEAARLAALADPKVVRYEPRLGLLAELLAVYRQSPLLGLDTKTLDELQTPRMLLMWKVD